jgi:hypothetical protein
MAFLELVQHHLNLVNKKFLSVDFVKEVSASTTEHSFDSLQEYLISFFLKGFQTQLLT